MQLSNAATATAGCLVRTVALGASMLITSEAAAADVAAPAEGSAPAADPRDFSRFDYIAETLAGWKVVAGGGAIVGPKFEGAKRYEATPLPFFMAEFGDRVSVDPRGVSVAVVKLEDFALGARGGYELGRDDKDDRHLRGLGDVDAGGVAGATAAYSLGPVTFKAGLDKTIGGGKGLVGTFGAEAMRMFGPLMLTAGASATWADDKHMKAYFGVTPGQSVRSGLSRHKAEAGIKRVDFETSATYMIDERWMARGQAGVGYLVGDAADSPIVQKKMQPSGMLMVGYRF